MEFNPSKCQVVHITRSPRPIKTSYTMHGHVLDSVDSARYLGVDISSNLSFSTHINRISSNASKSLGYLKRNILTKHPGIREAAYKTIVRPQLEKGTSRHRSGKGAIRKRFPLQKPRWEKTKLTIRHLYHETYRKPNEQLFSPIGGHSVTLT